MYKNTASQKWVVFAFDITTNNPVLNDAANITANVRLDGGSANAVDDTNPSELEDGYYVFDLSQAETNANLISIHPASATSDVQVIGCPAAVYTRTDLSAVPAAITVIDGIVDDILVDTGTSIPAQVTAVAAQVTTVDGIVDSILVDTGTDIPAQLSDVEDTVESQAADITAIKNTTDDITFTVNGQVDANIQYINDVQLSGNGDSTPMGAA